MHTPMILHLKTLVSIEMMHNQSFPGYDIFIIVLTVLLIINSFCHSINFVFAHFLCSFIYDQLDFLHKISSESTNKCHQTLVQVRTFIFVAFNHIVLIDALFSLLKVKNSSTREESPLELLINLWNKEFNTWIN